MEVGALLVSQIVWKVSPKQTSAESRKLCFHFKEILAVLHSYGSIMELFVSASYLFNYIFKCVSTTLEDFSAVLQNSCEIYFQWCDLGLLIQKQWRWRRGTVRD